MYVILVYDISGDEKGQKVLTKTHKLCKKYLTHVQNSVFEGELSEAQIMKLHNELNQIIRKKLDSVILFKSRNSRWLEKEMWAKQDNALSNFL
ncbi:MAG: CRISPR-associated endonuclease Cas2 [Anaerovorax sp.]|nr:CRISPR-associated endonuclease Cas2 [Anaerovorax sp.]